MFSSLFFLVVALLLMNFAPESQTGKYSPWVSLGIGIFGYCVCLTVIAGQNQVGRYFRKQGSWLATIAQIELLLFLLWYLYLLKGHRIFLNIPYFEGSQAIFSAVCLIFYLGGLAFFYFTESSTMLRRSETARQLRMVIPFLIPFMLFTVIVDAFIHIPNPVQAYLVDKESWGVELSLAVASFIFLGLSMIFLPFFIQKIWRCTPLTEPALVERLERICHTAKFRHAGMMTWTIMNRVHTAAIVGIVPRFRYVMFTQKLLRYLQPEEVEAVLAHEIGHSKKKHMLIYPFIILGMLIVAGLFSFIFSPGIIEYLYWQNISHPDSFWEYLLPLSVVIPYIIIIGCYFRIVFGYFSRLFERQADLFIFPLRIAPVHMVRALDQIALATGGTHHQPSWHHYSIQERIDFLEQAAAHPEIIERHHRKVRLSLWCYFIFITITSIMLISPLVPITPFTEISSWMEGISTQFSGLINRRKI